MKRYLKQLVAFLAIGLLCSSASVFCQEVSSMDEDPLGKPAIWKELEENPNDDVKWEEYYGKDLFSFSKDEYQEFEKMKRHLLDKFEVRKAEQELAMMKRKDEYLSKRYADVSKYHYQDLVQNINKNFPILEEYYAEKFKELGDQYVPYADVYPNGDFNKSKWVDEQEEKIEELQKLLEEYGDDQD